MNSRSFSLRQLPSEPLSPGLMISGCIGRSGDALSISYELTGSLAGLSMQAQAENPLRRNGLWEGAYKKFFDVHEKFHLVYE